ncbi:MAG: AbrB/MazE/SpoVT family DNA-binding domain-containing protein [Deltaproteobacteria bacterium]|jgi:bifunctional DNA-binding transcriptional regulator/antitoxin component of YhaV-PrlF toxin-antitoxin module
MEEFSTTSRLVRIRSRGQLTLPQDLREALNLDEESGLNVFRVGKVLLMTPKRLQRASLASEVEREMKREGLTLEDLLKDLKGQRKRYLAETYPKD